MPRTLDGADLRGKRVLLRADLNVPVRDGRIADLSRIERLSPTIRELADGGARVVVISHFDRPNGKRVEALSLAPMADALADVLGRPVAFVKQSVGAEAERAVAAMNDGDVVVLENTRFHPGEETNNTEYAAALARHGDVFVNDAFSAAHRAHASTEAIARHLPSYAGRLMQAELAALDAALSSPQRPVLAVVGGSKVSTKLALLGNLLTRVDVLAIGGAMANTFLAAKGLCVGKSLQEADMHQTARDIMNKAQSAGCRIVLPMDAVVAAEFRADPPTQIVDVGAIADDAMMLDVGPGTVDALIAELANVKTLVWNGPLGAFETRPFDTATVALAHAVSDATRSGRLISIAGGGDTVSALRHAGVSDRMTYVSSAGGAFLEWMEGKVLPGVAVLG